MRSTDLLQFWYSSPFYHVTLPFPLNSCICAPWLYKSRNILITHGFLQWSPLHSVMRLMFNTQFTKYFKEFLSTHCMITQHSPGAKWVITLWNKKQVLYEVWSWLYIPGPLLASPAMELVGEVRTSCPWLCPMSQLQLSCTINWTFLVKMCPPVPLSALTWSDHLCEQ